MVRIATPLVFPPDNQDARNKETPMSSSLGIGVFFVATLAAMSPPRATDPTQRRPRLISTRGGHLRVTKVRSARCGVRVMCRKVGLSPRRTSRVCQIGSAFPAHVPFVICAQDIQEHMLGFAPQ